ncbi:EamA family transporter [Marinomonas piezotolerans]|uniref:EamA family transporter n=1 Tax=Marinomonas piezotolerans TaxID=2213058 RepID=A0A370UBQ0_9GAMM|nr:EamA family transporter [Marinomonas piezotolerans]RDL45227.1 EamA family transporter [Marinomonas piezotolerans]
MSTTQSYASHHHAGASAILLASFLWGTTGTVASFAPDVSPLAIGAFAMGVGGLLQALIAFHQLMGDGHKLWQLRRYVLLGALGIATYPLAFYTSMDLAGVAIGTVVTIGSAPFATAILEWLISKKSPFNRIWLISLGLGLTGIGLLTFSDTTPPTHQANDATLWGVLLGLVAGASYAVYAWIGKHMIESGVHSKASISSMFGVSALLLLPSLYLTGDHLFDTANNATVVLYMAIIPMFCGYVLFSFGLKTTHASTATILTLFEPVVAAIFAVLIVGEHISAWGWLGMALIGLCLVLQTRQSSQSALQPTPN